VYQILTPDQQQKLASLRQARRAARQTQPAGGQSN
jgi:Spy/CpxP family protein refolding chaperone